MKREQLLSAGNVLVTVVGDTAYTVALHRCSPDEWRLPNGKLGPGETPRQAAIREAAQETGLAAEPQELVGRTDYEYVERRAAAGFVGESP